MGTIMARLDIFLRTVQWKDFFPRAQVYHLPRLMSDHMPFILDLEPRARSHRGMGARKILRF